MSLLKFVFIVAIIFCTTNRIIAVSAEKQTTDNANDFFFGNRTEGSVLLHSERIIVNGISGQYVNGALQWSTRGTIEEVYAIDMNRNGTGGHVQSYTIYSFSATLNFNSTVLGGGIDFIVFIYGQLAPPNHYIRGELSDISVLAQHSYLHVPAVAGSRVAGNVYFYGRNISRVEALDRSANGTGGMVFYSNGRITDSYMALYFESQPGGPIDFVVKFYVDAANDLFIGDEYDTTILLSASRVTASGVPGEIVQTTKGVISSNYTIGMISALDISEERHGARMNITAGGVGEYSISLSFASSAPGRSLDYAFAAYATAIEGVNNFRFGTWRYGDILIHREHFVIEAPTNGTAYGDLEFNGTHIISMFQGIDQNWNGSRLVTVSYGEGNTHVILSFRALSPGLDINFIIEIYGQ